MLSALAMVLGSPVVPGVAPAPDNAKGRTRNNLNKVQRAKRANVMLAKAQAKRQRKANKGNKP